jgi:hypothetical protein
LLLRFTGESKRERCDSFDLTTDGRSRRESSALLALPSRSAADATTSDAACL